MAALGDTLNPRQPSTTLDGANRGKPAIDIEKLLHWAYAQTVYLDCRLASERALAFNHGYTAIPKGCHAAFAGGDLAVSLLASSAKDAGTVVAAVAALDPWSRAIVVRCAKAAVRPDCFVGPEGPIEPREVEVKLSWRKRRKGGRKKAHKSVVSKRWEPCSPQAICAAREIYLRWYAALGRLAQHLGAELNDWSISGFSAPERPWETAPEKNA